MFITFHLDKSVYLLAKRFTFFSDIVVDIKKKKNIFLILTSNLLWNKSRRF